MRRRSIGSDGAYRLEAIDLFAGLTAGELRMLARVVDEVDAEPGEVLMREGDPGYEVIFLEDGSAEVTQGGAVIAVAGSGDMLGELALLDTGAGKRTATVVATAPLRGVVLTSHFMHHVRQQLPDVARSIDVAAESRRERDRQRAPGQAG